MTAVIDEEWLSPPEDIAPKEQNRLIRCFIETMRGEQYRSLKLLTRHVHEKHGRNLRRGLPPFNEGKMMAIINQWSRNAKFVDDLVDIFDKSDYYVLMSFF
jgi:hypothetical protein